MALASQDVDLSTSSTENNQFQIVRNKKKRRISKPIIGTSTLNSPDASHGLRGITTRYVSLFVSRLHHETSTEDMITYTKNKFNLDVKCEKIDTLYKTHASFKVEFISEKSDILYMPEMWPAGVLVRKFYKARSKN